MPELHSLGQYRIERQLGSGKYTDTYHATDMVRRRPVALKILRARLPVPTERFLSAAELASELVHPHLAWVWEAAQIEGVAYIAERYINGAPLAIMLAEAGALTWEDAFQIFRQIAQGLDFAHARNWVHGEIDPKNILISSESSAVLTDFGLATALRKYGAARSNPLYTAPELWEGQPPSPASDQYALGCILVEMLTGQALFAAPTTEEIKAKHLAGLEMLPIEPGGIPWLAVPILRRALGRNPAARYTSLGELVQALERLAEQVSESPEEHARRDQAARAWREAQQKVRSQAEEAARLAALEQARREIDEQIRHESSAAIVEIPEEGTVTVSTPASAEPGWLAEGDLVLPEFQVLERTRRRSRRSRPRGLWVVGLLLLLISLFFSVRWLSHNFSREGLFPYTATWTIPAATETPIPTPQPTATNTPTPVPTHTFTATLTVTGTASPTSTPTFTYTPTSTPTPTRTRTPTSTTSERKTPWGGQFFPTP